MKITKTDQINLGKGKLKLVKSKTYEVLKKDYIISQLSEKLDKSKAEDIADQLIKNRKTNEVSKIQRN
jgi:flagellin-specific chaperone FliS